MGNIIRVTETSMYHISRKSVLIAADNIERMSYDDEFRCTDIYLKGGRSLSVIEKPGQIAALIAI